jgi:2-keto-4-pentenoate hydratase/2-oxohepta-3-ene-1,7-dioic acid hydratase in catechol pathway
MEESKGKRKFGPLSKWCRLQTKEGNTYCLLDGDEVVEVDGSPFGNYSETTRRHPSSSAKVLVPVVPMDQYAVGPNYLEHSQWAIDSKIIPELPARPDFHARTRSALIGDGDEIIIPGELTEVHYEGEIIAVIGKEAKGVSESEADECVFGYTLGNDIAVREWQKSDLTRWRAKNADTFNCVGPAVATDLDPLAVNLTVRINGHVVSEARTADMLYKPNQLIALLTRYVTIHPGDLLWLGSQGATVPALKGGDVVEVGCAEIGVLENRVVQGPDLSGTRTGIAACDQVG